MAAKKPKLDTAFVAVMLSFADVHGTKAAAEKFDVSTRTLQRYRKRLEGGGDPELSQLVAENREQLNAACGDLLVETHREALEAIRHRLRNQEDEPGGAVKMYDLVGVFKTLNDAITFKNILEEDDDERPPANGAAGPGSAPGAGRGSADEAGSEAGSLH